MTLDQRLSRAVRHVADGVDAPAVDLDKIRSGARDRRRRTVSVVAAAAVVGLIAVTAAGVGSREGNAPSPEPIPPASALPTDSAAPLETDPRTWPTTRSPLYGWTLAHPPGWQAIPASRSWTWEIDAQSPVTPAHDAFLSPGSDVRVSVWPAPLDRGRLGQSREHLVSWIEDYCERSGNAPCTGIAERAVDLCLEKWDCHPGLLVPFANDVQAFFTGGIYDHRSITVVAVWRRDSHPSTVPYGGSTRLLEAFLSTMQVWPASTPLKERR